MPCMQSCHADAGMQTYTEAAKERAVAGAEVVTQKLQDLKVGIVGQEGAVSCPRVGFMASTASSLCKCTFQLQHVASAASFHHN